MNWKYKKRNMVIFVIYSGLFLVFCGGGISLLGDEIFYSYFVNGIISILSIFIFGISYILYKYTFFEPVTIFSILYFSMFFLMPLYDIVRENTSWFGVTDLFKYSETGTFLAFVGYLFFLFTYNGTKSDRAKCPTFYINHLKSKNKVPIIVIMYMVCFGANLFYLMESGGASFTYILTLGVFGVGGAETSQSSLGAISMLSFSLASCTLLYCEYGKNRMIKYFLFSLMFILQIARGFRFYIIQIVIMFSAYYFLRTKKKITIKTLGVMVVIISVPIIVMTLFRDDIRSGAGINLFAVSLKEIVTALDEAILGNFEIYKNYYALIKAVPNMTNFMYGKQMIIYTIIMFVPRALWPGKPLPPGGEGIALGVTPYAVMAGTAYPCLGEYYYEFGGVGIVICMVLLAFWMKKYTLRYYKYGHSLEDLMIYCTLLGCTLQLLIRGYTPSNFWMVVFCVLPYWIIKRMFTIPLNKKGEK